MIAISVFIMHIKSHFVGRAAPHPHRPFKSLVREPWVGYRESLCNMKGFLGFLRAPLLEGGKVMDENPQRGFWVDSLLTKLPTPIGSCDLRQSSISALPLIEEEHIVFASNSME